MGKRIIARARGKGGPRYRAPSHKYAGKVEYNLSRDNTVGLVIDIVHDPGRNAPVAIIKFPDKSRRLHIASEGLKVGDVINYWSGFSLGSVLPLADIPEGTKIFGIETYPGSGPKICRSSGSFPSRLRLTAQKTMPELRFSIFRLDLLMRGERLVTGVIQPKRSGILPLLLPTFHHPPYKSGSKLVESQTSRLG